MVYILYSGMVKTDKPFSLLIKTASLIMSIKENKQHSTDSQALNYQRKHPSYS